MKNKNIKQKSHDLRCEKVSRGIAKERFSIMCMMGLLEQIAKNADENGIIPLSKATMADSDNNVVIYDDFLDYGTGEKRYPIVFDCEEKDGGKLDVKLYMNDMYVFGGTRFDVFLNEDGTPSHIQVELFNEEDRAACNNLCLKIKGGNIVVTTSDDDDSEETETVKPGITKN